MATCIPYLGRREDDGKTEVLFRILEKMVELVSDDMLINAIYMDEQFVKVVLDNYLDKKEVHLFDVQEIRGDLAYLLTSLEERHFDA